MKQKLIRLSQRYVAALGEHLQAGPRASLQPALRLGRRALALGVETLELARIHERAVHTLKLSERKAGSIKRAEIFFAEALTPIVETHRAARRSRIQLDRLNGMLGRRTVELAASRRQWRRGVVRRKVLEAAAGKNGRRHQKCLQESLELQSHLRQLTHRALAAQEDERHQISHELQDEIAQTLLAINVRLVSLKQKARSNTRGLKQEIASTQRLVVKSARSVRRFARELQRHRPASSA